MGGAGARMGKWEGLGLGWGSGRVGRKSEEREGRKRELERREMGGKEGRQKRMLGML